MADFVFLVEGHFGKTFLKTFGTENRIVTESFVPVLACEYLPVDNTFKQVFISPEN